MSRTLLSFCGLVLAAVASTSASAAPLSFDFTFSTLAHLSGAGTFTAVADGTNQYLIASASGTTDTGDGTNRAINMLLDPGTFPSGSTNDNLLFYSTVFQAYMFDVRGVSYSVDNGALINLYETGPSGGVVLQRINGDLLTQFATIEITPVTSPVPEPGSLALLGTGVLGLAGVVRRRLGL